MSNKDLTLGEMDVDEAFEFPPPERKIVTHPYDLSLQTLFEQWETKSIVLPEIQREYVWDNGRASRLIESFMLNIPVPPVYFSERKDAVLDIIDGHQRIKSIVRYFNNEFGLTGLRVLNEYSRKRFHQLPEREQRFLKTRSLRTIVLSHDSHPNMKFEVFERLNTGGIALNAQELRNSLYRGTFNKHLKKLVKFEDFRNCIGSKNPRRRFVDEELILRWFALVDDLSEYRAPLKRFLNEYMDSHKNASRAWLSPRTTKFAYTMLLINQVLGTIAFRLVDREGLPLHDHEGKPFPRSVNRALFDAQAVAFTWVITPPEEINKKSVIRSMAKIYEQKDFLGSVQRATGNKSNINLRISKMIEALNNGGLELNIPKKVGL